MAKIKPDWADRRVRAAIRKVSNEHRNSDLRADNPDVRVALAQELRQERIAAENISLHPETLRTLTAAMVMAAIISDPESQDQAVIIAESAVHYANELFVQLAKFGPRHNPRKRSDGLFGD